LTLFSNYYKRDQMWLWFPHGLSADRESSFWS